MSFARRRPSPPADPGSFAWHLFVPCRDEAAVIGRSVCRLRADFPSVHIWVVDDDSEDGTGAIVAGLAATDPLLHLVRRRRPYARTGKGDALNAAYHALCAWLPTGTGRDRVLIGVVDADGALDPGVLVKVAGPGGFADPRVGAVQIAVWMANRHDARPVPGRGRIANALARCLIRMQDLEFRCTIAAMQLLRTHTASVGLGGNGQFTRLSVLDEIARRHRQPWHGALLEDYELGLHVLLAGYRNRYVHDAHVAQEALPGARRLLTQRTRWVQGNLQCLRYLPAILRSPHFSNAGAVEAGYFLLLPYGQLVGVLAWPVAGWYAGVGGWALVAILLLGALPAAVWGPVYRRTCEPAAPWWTGVGWGLLHWLYLHLMVLAIPRAFARAVFRRTGWAKTRRNAEVVG